ncbi:MAG TPA: UDP-3-O-acyl-N-acetylglucosamine deacetylase [Stellaceae bacterium]|jgi:UDP-3-O-[3-hydroxymyristoyl] N-acetylglucosamine deacetylase|nr:UDP-3-O-acyl-N-acetylglucosamine deacetylase [Stellaceae bacterium]
MLGDISIAPQRTLGAVARCTGIGLHSGRPVTMTLRPAAPDTGIIFRRLDAGAEIEANWANTTESALCTVLTNGEGIKVSTIEHLMAALAGSRIDNAIVELSGAEVPIMDGSAAPFMRLIAHAGIMAQDAARRVFKVLRPIRVGDKGATAELLPDHGFSMSFAIDYDNPLIRRQDLSLAFEPETFATELAPARTYGLLDDLPRLKAAGLALGGSLDNAVVISGTQVLNAGGLRFADECVRHKLLDAMGDLYLAGGPIIGHFRGVRSGHALTRRLLMALFADSSAWCVTTIAETAALGTAAWSDGMRVASA